MNNYVLEPAPLGKTKLMISPLSLGTVKLGRNTQVKYPQGFELPSDKEATALLELANASGINLIDTAPAYGESETRLGKLLPGNREDWIICTKAGEEYIDGQSHYDYSKDAITESVHRSLRRLNTDVLDIVLIHAHDDDVSIITETGAIDVLSSLKQRGDIRFIGMSSKSVEAGMLACDLCDVLMLTLNLEDKSQLPVIEKAKEQGVGVLLKKVMASGHAEPNDSLRYAIQTPGVHSAVIGTINPAHLMSNIEVAAQATKDLESFRQ